MEIMGDESVEMDQETAKRLLVEGATLILLNVPPGTEFGIDFKTRYTDEKFKGIKMIPPGIHMVHYSPTNKYGDVAPRMSFLHNFKTSEILIRSWDSKKEEISMKEFSEEEKSKFRADLINLDRYLGPYPFDVWQKWKKLSSKLTEGLITKLTPQSGVIRAALELQTCSTQEPKETKEVKRRSRTKEEKEEELLPELRPVPGTELRLTPLPLHSFPLGASPADITKHSLDSTYRLDTYINSLDNPSDVLGEIQFSFLCFLVGFSLEALEHWKQLIVLVCSCESAIHKRRELYQQFLQTLEIQLGHIPQDFLVDIVASENVIYTSLRELFRNMAEADAIEGRLRCDAERLRHRLTSKFGWDFEDLSREIGDEAPVVVDL